MCSTLSRLMPSRKMTSGMEIPRCILHASSKSLLKFCTEDHKIVYINDIKSIYASSSYRETLLEHAAILVLHLSAHWLGQLIH